MLEVLQVGDIEGDIPSAKRLRLSSSDALQDMVSGEELSLFGSAPNSADSAQVVYLSGNAFLVSVFFLLNLFHMWCYWCNRPRGSLSMVGREIKHWID